jgi:hypothetical protein
MTVRRNRMCLVRAIRVKACILSGEGSEGVVSRVYEMASSSVDGDEVFGFRWGGLHLRD